MNDNSKKLFNECPSCGSQKIIYQKLEGGGYREFCSMCLFSSTYVEFTCGCCNPDVFGICPNTKCKTPGTPTHKLCRL
ncbi:MAG TPA: hypothetical protein PKL37_22650 [Panacibacter sp.]|nr:hypothetical protein [Panacibacter sp.]